MKEKLKGSIVALVTPFLKSGEIDFIALTKLIEWHIASGTHGLVVNGSTGEGNLLTNREQQSLLEATVKAVGKRIPVIAGTGGASTAQVIENNRVAAEAGVDAVLVVAPFYVRPTQEGLYQHYKKIGVYSDLPIILYNQPWRTGVDLLPSTVAKLASVRNVIALKEAVPDLKRLKALRSKLPADFLIFSGEDSATCEWMQHGAVGIISVVANFVPEKMVKLCEALLSNQAEKAFALNEILKPLFRVSGVESNPIPAKFILWKMNKLQNVLRLPLTPLNDQHIDKVELVLKQAGVV